MRESRKTRNKGDSDVESVFKSRHKILLNQNQWSYLKAHYRLTNRELQVAKLVCRAFSSKEIANNLKIKHGTVKTHLLNIYRKVHVTSKMALLLTFTDDVSKLSAKSTADSAIPIVDIKKQTKKKLGLSKIHKKSK
jgi:DNA-binding CsgD family transcriptional regulator